MKKARTIKEHYAYASHFFRFASDQMAIVGASARSPEMLRNAALKYSEIAVKHVKEAERKEAMAATRQKDATARPKGATAPV